MFIAHLPASYLLTKTLQGRQILFSKKNHKKLMIVGLIGSVFPDIDIFYLYFFSSHPHHHHLYWTHLPVYWLLAFVALLLMRKRHSDLFCNGMIFVINVSLHLVLDTVAGDIWWLYPMLNKPFRLVTVPALYHPWWLNFIFHWTFGLELGLCLLAAVVYFRREKGPGQIIKDSFLCFL